MQRETLLIPGSAGEIRAERGSRPWGYWCDRSVLSFKAGEPPVIAGLPTVAWTGSLAELEGGGLFEDDPRTWGPKGWAALEEACLRLAAAGHRVTLRPHHRHIISDIPSCKRFIESNLAASAGIRLAHDPLSMCTDGMQAPNSFMDHLHRLFEAVDSLPPESIAAIVVPDRHRENSVVMTLVDSHIPPSIPLLLSP